MARRGDEMTLTSDDEAALDRAMNHITDADVAASIRWLDDIADDRPIHPTKALRQQKEQPANGRQPL